MIIIIIIIIIIMLLRIINVSKHVRQARILDPDNPEKNIHNAQRSLGIGSNLIEIICYM